jgi:hypothetical protein
LFYYAQAQVKAKEKSGAYFSAFQKHLFDNNAAEMSNLAAQS